MVHFGVLESALLWVYFYFFAGNKYLFPIVYPQPGLCPSQEDVGSYPVECCVPNIQGGAPGE